MSAGFTRIGDPGSFAFERGQESTAAGSSDVVLRRPVTTKRRGPSLRPRAAESEPTPKRSGKPAKKPQPSRREESAPTETPLEHARRCADRGDLALARRICEEHLAQSGPSSAAYCLLGIVKNAGGDASGAKDCFDRALYLEPDNHEALVHLALLHEQHGKVGAAAQLRRRAERARRTNDS
jgi:chemotaxis protein methyltransferase WspC